MSSFKTKMSRTRKYREDGTQVYNTLNSTGLVNKYKNTNSRFNSRNQNPGPCTLAGCGTQCCRNYFLITGIKLIEWGTLSNGTIFAPGNTIHNNGIIIGTIEDILFPNSNYCVPLGEPASDCSGAFPLDIRLIVKASGGSCATTSYTKNDTLIIGGKTIGTSSSLDAFVDSIEQEETEIMGSSRVGAPYRAPIAGYRKTLVCCEDAKDYSGCFIECVVNMESLKIYPNRGDYTYLQNGKYFGQVSDFKYTKTNNGYNLVIIFTFSENECYTKKSLLNTSGFILYSGDGSVYQYFIGHKKLSNYNLTKQSFNDVYKDPQAISCKKDARVCYDKRIRSGMQPNHQICVYTDSNGKKQKKLLGPSYSYSYSQYNKNRAMNTYDRGLEKNKKQKSCEIFSSGDLDGSWCVMIATKCVVINVFNDKYNSPNGMGTITINFGLQGPYFSLPGMNVSFEKCYKNADGNIIIKWTCLFESPTLPISPFFWTELNTYNKSGGNACVSCVDPQSNNSKSKNSITIWKPNNDKFKVQGAVSAGSRLDRLKLDTIRAGNSKYKKGSRCFEGNGNGPYFAGKPRFDGWMFNGRHREVVRTNKYRQKPFGIQQLTKRCRSTRSNKAPISWKDKAMGTCGIINTVTARTPGINCPKTPCPLYLCPGEKLPLSQGSDNARYTPSNCSKLTRYF